MSFTVKYNPVDSKGLGFLTGSYINTGGSSGGDIRTNMGEVTHIQIQPLGSAAVADQAALNETPVANRIGANIFNQKDLTIVTNANESGMFLVIGH